MNEFLKAMKALNVDIAALEGKRSEEKDDIERQLFADKIKAKNDEFEVLQGKVADEKAKQKREADIAGVEGDLAKVDTSKADGLKDAQVDDVKVTDSDHNRENWAAKCDKFAWDFLLDPLSDGQKNGTLLKADGVLLEACKGTDEGFRAPRSLAKYIMPQPTGHDLLAAHFSDRVADQFGAKVTIVSDDAAGAASGGASLFPVPFVPQLYRQERMVDDLPSRCFVKPDLGGGTLFPKLKSQSDSVPFGVSVTWGNSGASGGEGESITASDPTFTQIAVTTDRLAATTQASLKELRVDQIGLEAQIAWMMRNAVSRQISTRILTGTGTAPFPTGVNSAASITAGLNIEARDAASQVSYTDLSNLQFAVPAGLAEGGIYVLSTGPSGAFKYISGLKDTDGRPVLRNENWIVGLNAVPTLAGMPYMPTAANTQALGGRGDVVFGNFMNYGLVVGSVDIARSDQFAFDKGVITFRVLTYVGGKPLDADAFAVLGDPSGASSSSSSSSSST